MHNTTFKHTIAQSHAAYDSQVFQSNHDLFCTDCGDHVARSQQRHSTHYCAGSGKAIHPHDHYFKCLECQEVYLEPFHFEDTAICNQCAHASGMADVLVWERLKDTYDQEGKTPLILAIEDDDLQEVHDLLDQGVDPNKTYQGKALCTPLRTSIEHNATGIAQLLIEYGATIETFEHPHLLDDAILLPSTEMAVLLLQLGANVSPSWLNEAILSLSAKKLFSLLPYIDNSMLTFNDYATAMLSHHTSKLKVLLNFGTYQHLSELISSTGQNLLHFNSDNQRHYRMTAYLLQEGVSASQQDQDGNSPLHLAATQGNVKKARLLIKAGAKVNQKNSLGSSPLEGAAANNHEQMILCLIKQGAAAQSRNHHGWSALDIAIQNHHLEAADVLLSTGIIPNRENQGWTPLARAVADKQPRLVSKLIAAGADPNHACVLLQINQQNNNPSFFVGR
ncbi:MAG: ankyrin repeat domain-containing protein [Mariprofundaceae bacterium]|nr:ankyrin repeat domain-containing protein [Mariprofundaceae bacterium]